MLKIWLAKGRCELHLRRHRLALLRLVSMICRCLRSAQCGCIWNTGHCLQPPGWKLDPHPGHVCLGLRPPVPWWCMAWTATSDWFVISTRCLLAASLARHLEIVVSRVRFLSFRRSSTILPSARLGLLCSSWYSFGRRSCTMSLLTHAGTQESRQMPHRHVVLAV